jgi:hypothetical protein
MGCGPNIGIPDFRNEKQTVSQTPKVISRGAGEGGWLAEVLFYEGVLITVICIGRHLTKVEGEDNRLAL